MLYVSAQQTTFSKTYYNSGYHEAWSFIELSDSGFILVGMSRDPVSPYSFAMRTDKYGDSLWTRKYSYGGELTDIIKLTDSTFLVTGLFDTSRLAVQLGVLNWSGDTLLVRDYGHPFPGVAVRIEKTIDGGCVLTDAQSSDYTFLKIDSNLNEQWHQPLFNMPYGPMKIMPDYNNGYIAIGSGFTNQQPYEIARYDSSGSLIWQRHHGNQPAWDTDVCSPRDIVILSDSNYLIGTDGHDWQLMKINRQNGDTMWTRNFDSTGVHQWNDYQVLDIDTSEKNRYICAMSRYITLLDENGDSIWCKPKPFTFMYIHDIHKTSDGGFALCGSITDLNATILAFAKIDSLGNTVFTSIFNPEHNLQPLSFYPNPASNEINISPGSFASEKKLLFSLVDLQGRLVLQQQYDVTNPVDINAVPQGLYIATLKGKEKEVRGKVMVQR